MHRLSLRQHNLHRVTLLEVAFAFIHGNSSDFHQDEAHTQNAQPGGVAPGDRCFCIRAFFLAPQLPVWQYVARAWAADRLLQVLEAKQAIEKKFGYAVEQQKLIFAGRILQDDNTIASYDIPETGFLVLLVRKVELSSSLRLFPFSHR